MAAVIEDLLTEIGKLDADFPNYGAWDLSLPAGHWREIAALLHSTPVAGGEGLAGVASESSTPVASLTPPITAADVHHHPDNNQDSPAVKAIVAAAVEMANSGELFRQPTGIDAGFKSPPREGLQELRALSEAATLGIWKLQRDMPFAVQGPTGFPVGECFGKRNKIAERNAAFIVAACNYVREVLAHEKP